MRREETDYDKYVRMERSVRNTLTSLTVLLFGCVLTAQGQTPAFTSTGVLNAASQTAGPIAPGMLAFINGSNLGSSISKDCAVTLPVPTTCNGVSVLVNGQLAPVVYSAASELEFQVPFNVSGSSATIQVTSTVSGTLLSSAIVTVPAAATAPALYASNGGAYYWDNQQTGISPEFSTAVQPGDTLELYGTGFGATNPVVAAGISGPYPLAVCVAAVTVTINGSAALVQTAGLLPPDSPAQLPPGADEAVFTVPAGLAPGTYPMVLTAGGVQSQTVQLTVAKPPVTITSISPAAPLTGSNQVVTVIGTGFEPGLTVTMLPPGSGITTISGAQIQWMTAKSFQMTVTFSVAGAYEIRLANPDLTNSNTFAFTVGPSVPISVTNVVSGASYGLKPDGSGAIMNGFSGQVITPVQTGSFVTITGQSLSTSTRNWLPSDVVGLNGLPMSLDGVSVTIDGKSAAVSYISPTQINVQAPTTSSLGPGVPVVVKNSSGTASGTATLQAYAPAFFPFVQPGGASTTAPLYVVAVNNSDGSFTAPANYYPAPVTSRPAKPGEYVQLWGTGFGPTNPPVPAGQIVSVASPLADLTQLQVRIGGVPATVQYAGLGYAGDYQINVLIPALLDGDQLIVATINGVTSQPGISIRIKN